MLSVNHISKRFEELSVLNDINFNVKEKEIVVLIGPSGCGKSTLLNIISGLDQADSGTISGAKNKIACVFQDNRLLPWRSVWKNISLVKEAEEKGRIQELIEEVGLKGFENYYPRQLSGGMQKRCGIARAFYYEGELLLMDEPFQGLDYCLRNELMHMLLKLWKSNKQSVLFITHEIEEALTLATRIIVLSDRPSTIVKEFVLPGEEGRNPMNDDLHPIRKEILSLIMKGGEKDGIS
ncbi:ABC transporter ATP-binding protein [Konateibacter massiliensis]|uniref:ABC transporter ATP-binding protein n=1 Tax=Konateibacter massiliensis TaxID=2002841 RepID=UPI000C15443A|nr:ABC transporter ATP-binding protein [Konateibacter massiliensis]